MIDLNDAAPQASAPLPFRAADAAPDARAMRRMVAQLESERETLMAHLDALEACAETLMARVLAIPALLHQARGAAERFEWLAENDPERFLS